MRRRSCRSAVSPATRVRANRGRNCASPIIPTTNDASSTGRVCRANSYTSQAITTACDPVPRVAQNRPARNRRYGHRASNGLSSSSGGSGGGAGVIGPSYGPAAPREPAGGGLRPAPRRGTIATTTEGHDMDWRAAFATIGLFIASAAGAADWPGWRGPTGMGVGRPKQTCRSTWGGKDDDERRSGSCRCPGARRRPGRTTTSPARSSAGGRVFVTVSYWPGRRRTPRSSPSTTSPATRRPTANAAWDATVRPGRGCSPTSAAATPPRPRPPTPTGSTSLFGSAVLAALDHDGKPVWRQGDHPVQVRRGPRPPARCCTATR